MKQLLIETFSTIKPKLNNVVYSIKINSSPERKSQNQDMFSVHFSIFHKNNNSKNQNASSFEQIINGKGQSASTCSLNCNFKLRDL